MEDGIENDVPAMHGLLADVWARQHQGTALPGFAHRNRLVLGVDGAHARLQTRWADEDMIVKTHAPRQHGSCNRGAKAREREGAIDREPEPVICPAAFDHVEI